jgi:hypothetical protein
VLSAVGVPTLVLHGSEDQIVPVEAGAYTARRIRSARFVEMPGMGHLALGASTRTQAEVERFLTDVWQTGGWEDTEPDRMLRPSCSPTSSNRRQRRSSSATGTGVSCLSDTTS